MELLTTVANLSMLRLGTRIKYLFLGEHDQRLYFIARDCDYSFGFRLISLVPGIECSMRRLRSLDGFDFKFSNFVYVLERSDRTQTYSHINMQLHHILLINFKCVIILNVEDGTQQKYANKFDEKYGQLDFKDAMLVDGNWCGFAQADLTVYFGSLQFDGGCCTFNAIREMSSDGMYRRQLIGSNFLYHISVQIVGGHPDYTITRTPMKTNLKTRDFALAPSNETCCGMCEFSYPFDQQLNEYFRLHSMMMIDNELHVCTTTVNDEVAFYKIEFEEETESFYASQQFRISVEATSIHHLVRATANKIVVCLRYEWSGDGRLDVKTLELVAPASLAIQCLRVLSNNQLNCHVVNVAQCL
jgi:hypothetical protein